MGRANTTTSKTELRLSKSQSHAPLAQSVEHAAVNRSVVGSSPTRGASTSMAYVASGQRGEVFKPLTRILRVSTTTGTQPRRL